MLKKDYGDGIIAGEIKALNNIASHHRESIKSHDIRLRALERTAWVLIGGLILMQFLPRFVLFLKAIK